METLMNTAFPLQERRDIELQQKNIDQNPKFHNLLITDNQKPIGLLTYWNFTDFIYIEHFAIDACLRNKGYGKQVLSTLKERVNLPIILEVEKPTNELALRRIAFYQHQGFVLQDFPYQQPPYRIGDTWFPMRLMTYGIVDLSLARNTIYKEAYQIYK